MEKILWMDDDPSLLYLYQEEFADEGYEVVPARNGREALAALEKEAPRLVVMDLLMPMIDGVEALIAILSKNRQTPVILNTSYLHYQEKLLNWGIAAYVIKSSDLRELKKKIRDVLESEKGREKNRGNFRWLETQSVG